MNGLIAVYEQRLKTGADALDRMEAFGNRDGGYHHRLRRWLELLAAYEYETEMAEAGLAETALAAVI